MPGRCVIVTYDLYTLGNWVFGSLHWIIAGEEEEKYWIHAVEERSRNKSRGGRGRRGRGGGRGGRGGGFGDRKRRQKFRQGDGPVAKQPKLDTGKKEVTTS